MNDLVKQNYSDLLLSKDNKEVLRHFEVNYINAIFEKYLSLKVPKPDIINFFHKAQLTGANPMLEQIYLIPRQVWQGQGKPSIMVGTVVFSYHFIEQKAQESGEYEGFKSTTDIGKYFNPKSGQVEDMLYSECTVTRKGKQYTYKAWFEEFCQRKNDGSLMGNWASKPYLMLEKCARSNALKSAFPDWIKAMSSIEELGAIEKEDHFIEAEFRQQEQLREAKVKEVEAEKKKQSENDQEKIKYFIDLIHEDMNRITKGFSVAQKGKSFKTFLGITQLNELQNFSLEVLIEKSNKLKEAIQDTNRLETYRNLMLEAVPKEKKQEMKIEGYQVNKDEKGKPSFTMD